jgi:lipoprotein-releasing system permease protein
MKFETFVAFRYLRSKRHEKFISFISLASFIGVTIGVMTLVTVLSVMNGFQETIRDKIINTGYHVYLTTWSMDQYMRNPTEVRQKVEERYPDAFVTPFFKGQVLIRTGPQRMLAVDIQGVEKDIYDRDLSLKKAVSLAAGKFDLSDGKILIGLELAKFLGVTVGDEVDVISPEGRVNRMTGLMVPVMKRYKISGLFKSGYYEYDLKLVFTSLQEAQALFDRPGQVWGLGMKVPNIFRADAVAWQLKKMFNGKYQAYSWMMFNHNFFVALKNEKAIMGFIVLLIVLVAAFNIASSLIMMVMEKKKDIGIMLAMGASQGQISRIFIFNGMLMAGIGMVIGVVLGLLLSFNLEAVFNAVEWVVNGGAHVVYLVCSPLFGMSEPEAFHILARDVYYLDKLPVSVHASEVTVIAIATLVISFLFSIIPARQAAKLNPVEAIRYE